MPTLARNEMITIAVAVVASVLAGALTALGVNAIVVFVVAAVALATLASVVGLATEQLGTMMGPGATGVVQSALGNLPELFVSLFALRAGLVTVVQTALIGSILANSLLVLGLAFLFGGSRHGTQRFGGEAPRAISVLTMLAVAALIVPTLAHELHTPAAAHSDVLSAACAVLLLIVFIASIPMSLKGGPSAAPEHKSAERAPHGEPWARWFVLTLLAVSGAGAALVSDWFVAALTPTITALGLSEAFTGLVIVAIAGNAVENVVGIQLALANKADYAVSVILNSSLQIALALTPILVLLSFVVGSTPLTLVMPPLLLVALFLATLIGALIVFDGESTWLEGVALIGLYGIVAATFWWG